LCHCSTTINGNPEEIYVDLQFNPTTGFEANAREMNRGFQTIHLTERNIIDGIIDYQSDFTIISFQKD
jgi:hypothetical protein